MSRDHNEIVESIKTLDEAKQFIRHLLATQDDIYTVLTYELRTPLLLISGYAEMTKREELTQERVHFLKVITHNVERILRMIDATKGSRALAEWRFHQKSLLEYYPPESVNLNPTLTESISQIQKSIDFEDDMRAHQAESDKKKGNKGLVKQPVKFKFNIDDNLPIVQLNSGILGHIMSDAVWFITTEPVNDDIFIVASFDEQWVKVTLGYSTNSNYFPRHLMDDCQKFETASTSHEFSWDSLLLYNIWFRLKAYGGELSVNLQDNRNSNTPSKTEITISLKR